ncbi:hypothetical protein ACIBEJ_00915 [Nonomuraea sp. NPDC050790]|uniref:hypothetical protein n=1 Tax=Nonomuraea sp. NPDC050790 TaxID=3364371 RepID=UPI0037BB9FAF
MIPSQLRAETPQVPPSPAAQVQQLINAAERRGLKAAPVAETIVRFIQQPDYSALTPQERAQAMRMFPGLSQIVVLLPDKNQQPDSLPMGMAWYWWWRGDRVATAGASGEIEHLAAADDIEFAAEQISKVLALEPTAP